VTLSRSYELPTQRRWTREAMKREASAQGRCLEVGPVIGPYEHYWSRQADTETVRLGLEALVRRGAYERLRALRGSEPQARETRRRRERTSSAKHSAA